MNDDKNPSQLTHSQLKILNAGSAVFNKPATAKDAAFMARELVQCTLPHKNPGDVPLWKRTHGNLTLGIQPGMNLKTGKSYGYPYGTIPRLLLFWMITEAIRTKSRRLELGNSLASFMRQLGLDSNRGGKRGDAKRLRNQMERLFRSHFSFEKSYIGENRSGNAWLDMQVAPKGEFWWSEKNPEQANFWGSWIELGEDFYNAIIAAPVPVDMRILLALKKSPLALDLYAWLVYEAFIANKSGKARFTSFESLHSQLGSEYADLDDFRKKGVRPALAKIKAAYQDLKLGKKQGGIEILPESLPAIQPRNVTIEGTATEITPRPTMPAPVLVSALRPLKPRTIERFRAACGRLDPYACQSDFEAWLEDKPNEREPKNYDAAFLGFAQKWSISKL